MGHILITVDVEDWFQVENLRSCFPIQTWSSCVLRVEANTYALLDLFARFRVSATFFVLGWIAERVPDVVREIAKRGHEVASHGYGHQLCSQLSRSMLKEDLHRSKVLLEDITGNPVHGYRAPSFSINKELMDLLCILGYRYDSSFNDFALHGRYGKGDETWRRWSKHALIAENGLFELPISNIKVGRGTIPWGGGGYFRLWPRWAFELGVAHILSRKGCYLFYCHPWEFDDGQPRRHRMRPDLHFRHYVNLSKTRDRMESFLSRFSKHEFAPCAQFLTIVHPA